MKKLMLMFLVIPSFVSAANLPMAKDPVSSGAELAEKVKQGKTNASPQNYVDALRIHHPEAGVVDDEGLYLYLQNLEVVSCPQGVAYSMSSVTTNKKLELWKRKFGPKEKCLMDRNTQEVVASASCGNIGAPIVAPLKKPLEKKVEGPCSAGETLKFDAGKWGCVKTEPPAPIVAAEPEISSFAKAIDEEIGAQVAVPTSNVAAVQVPLQPRCTAYIDSNGMPVPEGYRRVPGGGRVRCK